MKIPFTPKPSVPIPAISVFDKLRRAEQKLNQIRNLCSAYQVQLEQLPDGHPFRDEVEKVLHHFEQVLG